MLVSRRLRLIVLAFVAGELVVFVGAGVVIGRFLL